jgi:hypothetical protein
MDQENTDAIYSQVVVNVKRGDPRNEDLEFESDRARWDGPNREVGKQEFGNCNRETQTPNPKVIVAPKAKDGKHAHERQEKQQREKITMQKHEFTSQN